MAERRLFDVQISLLEGPTAGNISEATYVVRLPVDDSQHNCLVRAIDEAKQMLIESIASGYVRG